MKVLVVIVGVMLSCLSTNAQLLPSDQDSATHWFAQMRSGEDSSRVALASQLEQLFVRHFSNKNLFATNLDSLPFLGQLRSDDGKLLMLCWNVVFLDESLRYYCIAFYKSDKKADVRSFVFQDDDADWEKITRKSVVISDWYGALYYKILTNRHKKRTYYTLLGWDGHDFLTNRKLVDVLTIEQNRATLGAQIFVQDNRPAYRMVFEYANDASMALNWDDKEQMIVMDHLAPTDAKLKGQYQFYGPDFSYDGLKFAKGKWVLQLDLEANNKGLNNLKEGE